MTSYWAGKKRVGRELSACMLNWIEAFRQAGFEPFQGYCEPFLGMGGVLQYMLEPLAWYATETGQSTTFAVLCSDQNVAVANFWVALAQGWQPPEAIPYEEYERLKRSKHEQSAMHAYVGYGTGFHSQYFKGIAPPVRMAERLRANHASVCALRALLHKIYAQGGGLNPCFGCADFFALEHQEPHHFIYYLDPPYGISQQDNNRWVQPQRQKKRRGQDHDHDYPCPHLISHPTFDSQRFWAMATAWSRHSLVFVSETQAPPDWVCIWQRSWKHGFNQSARYSRTERLFIHESTFNLLRGAANPVVA